MKLYIGVDSETEVVRSVATTPANVHDVTEVNNDNHSCRHVASGDIFPDCPLRIITVTKR